MNPDTTRQYGEYAYPDPGVYESINCGICGDEMTVRRKVFGPTSFGAAMAQIGRLHDAFRCPNMEEQWHIQAKKIKEKARESPSKVLEALLLKEADEILQTREATKKVSKYF